MHYSRRCSAHPSGLVMLATFPLILYHSPCQYSFLGYLLPGYAAPPSTHMLEHTREDVGAGWSEPGNKGAIIPRFIRGHDVAMLRGAWSFAFAFGEGLSTGFSMYLLRTSSSFASYVIQVSQSAEIRVCVAHSSIHLSSWFCVSNFPFTCFGQVT